MSMTIFKGILIPFLGTSLGAACVLFHEEKSALSCPASLDRLCGRSNGGCRRVELANTLYGAISENG